MNQTVLTEFIDNAEVKRVLNANIAYPEKPAKAHIVIPKVYSDLSFVLIGYAYEYWLQRALFPRSEITGNLIGYKSCINELSRNIKGVNDFLDYVYALNHARDIYALKVLKACLYFAYYEMRYRAPFAVDLNGPRAPEKDLDYLEELTALARGTDRTLFFSIVKGVSYPLKPFFDIEGSKGLMLGDGDVIVGDTLLDAKVTVNRKIRDGIRQLVGYWAMNQLIAEQDKNRDPWERSPYSINYLALYYPRFNTLLRYSIEDVLTRRNIRSILTVFRSYLGRNIRYPTGVRKLF